MTETLNIRIALQGLNEVSKGITGIGDRMRSVVAAVSAVGAAVAGSAIVREFAAINGEIAKTATEAEKFGVSTEFLSSFQYALRATGVEQSKLAEAMKGYVEKAQSQGRAIGDLSAELMRQAEVFSRMPDGPQKTAVAMNLFGEAGIALIPVLNKGEDGLRELTDEARRFGIVVDGDAAKAAKAMKLDMERLGASFEGVKMQLVTNLTPAFTELSKTIGAMFSKDGEGPLKRFSKWTGEMSERVGRNVVFSAEKIRATFASLWSGDTALDAIEKGWVSASQAMVRYESQLAKVKTTTQEVKKAVEILEYGPFRTGVPDAQIITGRMPGLDGMTDVARRDTERERAKNRLLSIEREIFNLAVQNQNIEQGQTFTENGQVMVTQQLVEFRQKMAELRMESEETAEVLNSLGGSETAMVWNQTMLDLQNQWGSWAAQMAATFANVFNTGISSISQNLTGVIMRTQSWGQALANIGTTILSTVINAIIAMGVRWVATQILMATAGKAIQAASISAMVPLAAAQAAVWSAPATLATIASYGAAAAASPGFIAAAQGIVLGKALSGFAEGGYTGNLGTSTPAGIVHGQEFVMSAPATASIGIDALEAMNATGAVPQAAGGREQRIIIVSDERTARDLEQDPEFENTVVSLMGKNAWRMRG